ncbi:hypothetical protein PIB30_008376 [Stylosanthes scabra]|uniref:Uncharacterized protein n=1 Tax=Stylosanthes scabra TaxID=79078 RepID=A0ABU6U4D6_9FABA|nr:hypothetical protein [Stylosanthes scabra]
MVERHIKPEKRRQWSTSGEEEMAKKKEKTEKRTKAICRKKEEKLSENMAKRNMNKTNRFKERLAELRAQHAEAQAQGIELPPIDEDAGFQSIEGRYLKVDDVHGVSTNTAETYKNTEVSTTGLLPPPPEPAIGHDVDDFRPTEPGHSPGVGHSIHN